MKREFGLSPRKIVEYRVREEESVSPERLSGRIVERSEEIHRSLLGEPSEVEVEMCVLGYRACADDLITLGCMVNEELPNSGLIRRLRLKMALRRAADALSRVRKSLSPESAFGIAGGANDSTERLTP